MKVLLNTNESHVIMLVYNSYPAGISNGKVVYTAWFNLVSKTDRFDVVLLCFYRWSPVFATSGPN